LQFENISKTTGEKSIRFLLGVKKNRENNHTPLEKTVEFGKKTS